MKIGFGWDSHEFKAGIPLIIGGVGIPHSKGLGGHSDGDVLLHAITDALLGAVAAPDIGSLFPPSDPQWKGADSVVFLKEAMRRIDEADCKRRFRFDFIGSENWPACGGDPRPCRGTVANLPRLRWLESEDTRRDWNQ
jgi:hypothetical protein